LNECKGNIKKEISSWYRISQGADVVWRVDGDDYYSHFAILFCLEERLYEFARENVVCVTNGIFFIYSSFPG